MEDSEIEVDKELIPAVVHGYEFEGMYDVEDSMTLQDSVIESAVFDKEDNFAGFILLDVKAGELIEDSPFDTAGMRMEYNDPELLGDANSHTRVAGFRTTKRCSTAKTILSVQPIYYSIDEKMCKETLKPIPTEMFNEISSYGLDCKYLPL